MDFSSILDYPLSSHHGLVVVRLPNEYSVPTCNARIVEAIRESAMPDMKGMLMIVEPSRTRTRGK